MSVPLTRSRLALLVLLLAAAAGIVVWLARPDPRLVKAQRLQQRLASDEIRGLPPEQQRQLRAQLQSEVQALSPPQQRVLDEQNRRLLIEKIDRYRALSKAEQIAFLDEEIDRLRALHREQESAAGKQTDGGSARTGRRRTPGANADERESYLKHQLDASTPEQRAKLSDLVKQLVDRAKERGLLGTDFPDDLQAILALIF